MFWSLLLLFLIFFRSVEIEFFRDWLYKLKLRIDMNIYLFIIYILYIYIIYIIYIIIFNIETNKYNK